MRMLVEDGGRYSPASQLAFQQTRQAIAVADCIGRLIPQEGIDYDLEIIFKGSSYSPSISMNIVPHTDKGEWWKRYVSEMIKKYPPQVENPEMSIPEEDNSENPEEPEVVDAEVVS